jgi:hypothetical protein
VTGHSKSFVPRSTGPAIRETHVYQPAPGSWPSTPPCATCDMPKASRVHDVGEVPVEAREIDARVLGESNQEEIN